MGDDFSENSDNSTTFSFSLTLQLEKASSQFMQLKTNAKVSIV